MGRALSLSNLERLKNRGEKERGMWRAGERVKRVTYETSVEERVHINTNSTHLRHAFV